MSESSILPLKRRGGPEIILRSKRHAGRSANLPCGKLSRFRYKKIVPKKNLGNGSYGIAYLANDTLTGMDFVVKVVRKTNDALKEIETGMKMMDSQFVCRTYGYAEDEVNFYIIMSNAGNTDLFTFISENPTIFVENPLLFWSVAHCILQGIRYIHQRFVHMDLKPENVCFRTTQKGKITGVKIIDFGFSVEIGNNDFGRGTANYMSPEIASGYPGSRASDIWSLGVLFYVMLSGSFCKQIASKNPNKIKNASSVSTKLREIYKTGKFTPFSQYSSDSEIFAIQKFIERCLVVESEKRPTADELLGHIPSHLTDLVTQSLGELSI